MDKKPGKKSKTTFCHARRPALVWIPLTTNIDLFRIEHHLWEAYVLQCLGSGRERKTPLIEIRSWLFHTKNHLSEAFGIVE